MLSEQGLLNRAQARFDFYSGIAATTGAYSTGQVIGGAIAVDATPTAKGPNEEPQLSTILQSLALNDPAGQSAAIDLFFFNAAVSTGASTDKSAFAPSAADMLSCIGVVSIAGADYAAAGSASVAAGKNQANLGHVLKPAGNATGIYCVPVSRGTPNYGSTPPSIRLQLSQGL